MAICTPACWTPVTCPTCGNTLPPAGRSVPLEMHLSDCCLEMQSNGFNKRHLWDEHDSTRHYIDPDGWAEHVAACARCRGEA